MNPVATVSRRLCPSPAARTPRGVAAGLSVLALSLWLGGCSVPLPDKPQRPQPYDLGPPLALAPASVASDVAAGTAMNSTASALGVARPVAPRAIDGTAIIYRLLYTHDGLQPRPYAQARWVMPPAQMLEQRLREAVALTRPVVDAGRGLAPVELHIELEEFAQVFSTPDSSEGVVRLRVTAVAPAGKQRLLGQRSFTTRQPAPTADATGGVMALRAATDEAIAQITQWVGSLGQP